MIVGLVRLFLIIFTIMFLVFIVYINYIGIKTFFETKIQSNKKTKKETKNGNK